MIELCISEEIKKRVILNDNGNDNNNNGDNDNNNGDNDNSSGDTTSYALL
ncbi:hypothetical protein [Plasmodium yoelii yoelii]|uniref:Uncharacterized protein n=1 Tax=Plasmodium yoelii yoelii TaxID=73239 RepID=Q7RN87_PLAYO|nr:hypothetical protein [Plasmodium yoelii yoelii]